MEGPNKKTSEDIDESRRRFLKTAGAFGAIAALSVLPAEAEAKGGTPETKARRTISSNEKKISSNMEKISILSSITDDELERLTRGESIEGKIWSKSMGLEKRKYKFLEDKISVGATTGAILGAAIEGVSAMVSSKKINTRGMAVDSIGGGLLGGSFGAVGKLLEGRKPDKVDGAFFGTDIFTDHSGYPVPMTRESVSRKIEYLTAENDDLRNDIERLKREYKI